jgi:hypothetical protein
MTQGAALLKGRSMTSAEEHAETGADPAHTRKFEIIVNGRKREVSTQVLTFNDVVALAFNPVPTGPNILFTITYEHGPHDNAQGSLQPGESVEIKSGMTFDVTPTDKS